MKRLGLLVALGVVAMAASDSRAGTKVDKDALLTTTDGVIEATGALGSVRRLSNGSAYASCTIEAGPTATAPVITCWIKDRTGAEVGCSMIDMTGATSAVLATMNNDSLLTFRVNAPPGPGGDDAAAPATDAGGAGTNTTTATSTVTISPTVDPVLAAYALQHWPAGQCAYLAIENNSKWAPKQ